MRTVEPMQGYEAVSRCSTRPVPMTLALRVVMVTGYELASCQPRQLVSQTLMLTTGTPSHPVSHSGCRLSWVPYACPCPLTRAGASTE